MVHNERDEFAIDIAARLLAMRTQEAATYTVTENLADGWQRRLKGITKFVAEAVAPSPATLALLAIRARERANAPSGAAAKAAVARNADQAKRQRLE